MKEPVPGYSDFEYDDEEHLYYVKGKVVPSVTQILSDVGIFDASKYPDLEYYRDRGRAIHRATELWEQDTLDEDSLDDRIRPYLEAFKKFKRDEGFVTIGAEIRAYDPNYLFAGTMDRLGELRGDAAIVDIKTSQVEPWVAIQLAGYELLAPVNCVKRYGLALRNDETYKLVPFRDRTDRKVFLAALTVAKWKGVK